MNKSGPEFSGRFRKRGYPVRILGEFDPLPLLPVSLANTPTVDEIIKAACSAVQRTQNANRYPRAIMGKVTTAAPESAKNGSGFVPTSNKVYAHDLYFLRELLPEGLPEIDTIEGLGVYVTSPKKKAKVEDIDGLGVVLCNSNVETISSTLMSREAIGELSEKQIHELGNLVMYVALGASLAHGPRPLPFIDLCPD